MSTIHHHPAHPLVWFWAAAAVAAGFLAVLVITVFASSSGSGDTSPPPNTNVVSHGQGPMFRELCSAMRPGLSIELARSGCTVVAP